MAGKLALATVLHDPEGQMVPHVTAALDRLRDRFDAVAVCLTEATAPHVRDFFADRLNASIGVHPTGEDQIGFGRRRSVELALGFDCTQILYADLDHVLRWLDVDRPGLDVTLDMARQAGLTIIGRSEVAMKDVPRRLVETEEPLNRAYTLLTGRQADLFAAVRAFDRATAETIVTHSRVDSFGNDVEWPLLAERHGHRVIALFSDALTYRTMEEFGAASDSHDRDPAQWLRRITMAAEQALAFGPFLGMATGSIDAPPPRP